LPFIAPLLRVFIDEFGVYFRFYPCTSKASKTRK
jgi:hypothetical protein